MCRRVCNRLSDSGNLYVRAKCICDAEDEDRDREKVMRCDSGHWLHPRATLTLLQGASMGDFPFIRFVVMCITHENSHGGYYRYRRSQSRT
ncbi:hypothetical protein VNO80_04770 [Phaseolus coccineus]|uniref:Uncharacterized protein n=1 Tax=Phaseolus coccineus TaxID=3886 RepID=A0AAN9P1E6_PHACN